MRVLHVESIGVIVWLRDWGLESFGTLRGAYIHRLGFRVLGS